MNTGPRSVGRLVTPRVVRGVTLIELMVALVLGLIVAGAAMAVFITNRQTYTATESLGRLQEGGRIAFELLSRDLREAGSVPCSEEATFKNVVVPGDWWSEWSAIGDGLKGYGSSPDIAFPFGTDEGNRASGTDAIELKNATPPGVDPIVITAAATPPNDKIPLLNLTVNNVADLHVGDILMACDYGYYDGVTVPNKQRSPAAAIFQAMVVSGTNIGVEATTGTPGNITDAWLVNSDPNVLQPNGLVSVVHAMRWYIGHNAVGGTSLYRSVLRNTAGSLDAAPEEIVRGADKLNFGYLLDGGTSYVDAGTVGNNWNNVKAVRVTLRLVGADRVDDKFLERTFDHVITIRSRAL